MSNRPPRITRAELERRAGIYVRGLTNRRTPPDVVEHAIAGVIAASEFVVRVYGTQEEKKAWP